MTRQCPKELCLADDVLLVTVLVLHVIEVGPRFKDLDYI